MFSSHGVPALRHAIGRARRKILEWKRGFSTGNLYVHRTFAQVGGDSTAAASTIGLFSALQELKPGIGYFRPIDKTSREGQRSQLVKSEFGLEDEVGAMQGLDQSEAFQLLVDDNIDDLLEKIFLSYERYRRRHEFVMIEGTHLNNLWKDTLSLNAKIASALGAPALLATDASASEQSLSDFSSNWTTEVAMQTHLAALAFKKFSVGVSGAFVYGSTPGTENVLRKLFSQWKLPLLGCIPLNFSESSHAKELFRENLEAEALKRVVQQQDDSPMSPLLFRNSLLLKARDNKQVILLPEGEEPRTMEAAAFVLKHNICELVLLGDDQRILEAASKRNLDLSSAAFKDPADPQVIEEYANVYFQARAHKGITIEQARETLRNDSITLGTCIVSAGDADGMVSGAVHTTANTIRPALQIIKTEPGVSIVSSVFFICLQNRVVLYADIAINTSPSAEELATIAISTADTAKAFGIEPRVALLSYATGDSNAGPLVKKVADAAALANTRRSDLLIEGPFQYDAAINPATAAIKLRGRSSAVAGKANVFIFPDLNASNIACKAVQLHTGAVAIGPILQGLRKPVNDLSRGCSTKDIIATITTTAVQASQKKMRPVLS